MTTDNIHIFFTARDIDVLRHHKGNCQNTSLKMIKRLVKLGIVITDETVRPHTFRAKVDDFLFHFVLRYHPPKKQEYLVNMFPKNYQNTQINTNYSFDNNLK